MGSANLAEFDCGCIGIPKVFGDRALLFQICDADRDDPDLVCRLRNMHAKTHEPVSDDLAERVLGQIRRLVNNGHSLKLIRDILGGNDGS